MTITVKLSDNSKVTWFSNEPKNNGFEIGMLDIQTEHGFIELTVKEQVELLRFLKPRYEHLLDS